MNGSGWKWIVGAVAGAVLTCAIHGNASAAAESIRVEANAGKNAIGNATYRASATTPLDKEAVQTARAEFSKHARVQGDSTIVVGNFGFGQYRGNLIAMEIKSPVVWVVQRDVVSRADELNGVTWRGEIYLHCDAFRVSKSGLNIKADPTLGSVVWSDWQDCRDNPKTRGDGTLGDNGPHVAQIELAKVSGTWRGLSYGKPGELAWLVGASMDHAPLYDAWPPEKAAAPSSIPVTDKQGNVSSAGVADATRASGVAGQSAAAVSLVGRWIAGGESKGKPYRYRFDFVEGANGTLSGTFKYEPPGCKGTLVAKSAAPPNYEFTERIDDPLMLLKCGAPAALRVQVPSEGIAVLEKFDPANGRSLGRVTAMRQGDAESPSPAAAAVTGEGAAATATATVNSPTDAPGGVAGPVLRMDGVGPVKVGMTVAQAQKALGEKIALDPTLDASCNVGQAKKMFPSLSFMTVGGVIARIDTTDPAVRTPEGAHVGSTEQEIRKLYGSRVQTNNHQYVEGGHYMDVHSGGGLGMVLETDGNAVTKLRSVGMRRTDWFRAAIDRAAGCIANRVIDVRDRDHECDVKDVTWPDENRVKWVGTEYEIVGTKEDADICTGRSKPRQLSLVDDTSKWTPPDYFVP